MDVQQMHLADQFTPAKVGEPDAICLLRPTYGIFLPKEMNLHYQVSENAEDTETSTRIQLHKSRM